MPDRSALREHARAIWQAAVEAVRPHRLLQRVLSPANPPLWQALSQARRILVVGAGKAGAAMSAAVEAALEPLIGRIEGVVNVPAESVRPLRAIRLHAARPAGSNEPTRAGVDGARAILALVSSAGPSDVILCLLSGGGSALLPAPVDGVSLEDKQQVTRLLHASGATINEMNAVRKHLSQVKGGRLAQAARAGALYSLIISDVIGDPLDVIASGPTAPDPTTYAEAVEVLERFELIGRVPASVLDHLRRGRDGGAAETPKELPENVHNQVIGNNVLALAAAQRFAERLGYRVLNLGSYLEGETQHAAHAQAGLMRSMLHDGVPLEPPACLLSGGETTVTLGERPGKGGRNQEFVLALLHFLRAESGLGDVALLSGGSDGEDGPTDAAGALADAATLRRAAALGLKPADFLARHDAYHFFAKTGDLLITGLTETNVMDIRVLLLGRTPHASIPPLGTA